jgi:hypothetical protein|tara:strand:+ start:1423 stop:1689 length:267 start_codon:yes stop_codon:yes gene_type:complete
MKTPNYYKGKVYGYEAHEVIEDFAGDNYNIGVALAYLMRAGKKPDNDITKDLQKTIDHLNFEIKRQNNIKEAEQKELLNKYSNATISN